MTTPQGQKPSIIIDLITDASKFLASVQSGLNQALNQVKAFASNAQQTIQNAFSTSTTNAFSTQATALNAILLQNQQQFAALTVNVNKYRSAVQTATSTTPELQQGLIALNQILPTVGNNWTKAGIIAVSSGQATVNAVNQILIANGKAALSITQLTAALGVLGANVNLAAQGLPLVATAGNGAAAGLSNTGAAAKSAGNAFDYLATRIKTIVSSLIIVQGIYQAINAIKDLIASSQELAQTQYELAAAVDFANKVSDQNIGSLADWQKQIDAVSAKFKVFTKQDITDATTKALELGSQLNLTAAELQKLTDIAAVLAEKHGKTLTETLTSLINAVAGGRLQSLKELGVVLRTTDLQVASFSQGLGTNINDLSDAARAQIVLTEVLKDYNEQASSAAHYTSDLAGQLKEADTNAQNSKDSIAEDLTGLNLLFKNLYADFLVYIAGIADKFKPLKDFINQFNNSEASKNAIGAAPTLESILGVQPSGTNGTAQLGASKINTDIAQGDFKSFVRDLAFYKDLLGITNDQMTQLTYAAAKYINALKAMNEQIREQHRLDEDNQGQAPGFVPGGTSGGTSNPLSIGEAKAVEDTNDKINKLFADEQKELDKAENDYWDDFNKNLSDKVKKTWQNQQKLIDDLARLTRNTGFKVVDAQTKLDQELVDLQTNQNDQIADAQNKFQKAMVKNKSDYYDALKQLDNQYYFDIFDAVANNDAIALYKAEQKYALEKGKLTDKFNDDNTSTKQNYQDEINQIKLQTERRAAELKLRHDRELADIALNDQRERDQLIADNKKEQNAINDDYITQKNALAAHWETQKATIKANTTEQFNQLTTDLGKALTAHQQYFFDLVNYWVAYYQSLLNLQGQYQGVLGVPPVPTGIIPPTPAPDACIPGFYWDGHKCVHAGSAPSGVTDLSSTDGNQTKVHKIILTSDGTVSDDVVSQVARELSNAIQTMVVERGG